jgi:hypothetical protein
MRAIRESTRETALVLGRQGYETAVRGKNGFSIVNCVV